MEDNIKKDDKKEPTGEHGVTVYSVYKNVK
jgi:hypothetical protein